jgi:RNA polymerase sigma-70 factor, ECF subfamily
VAQTGGFDEFYQAVFGRLVGQLFLVTGDLSEAEDLVQESLARASARWSRLAGYDQPEAWVRRVALNLAANRARQVRRRLRALADLPPARTLPGISDDTLALAEALRQLPIRHRQALVLHYLFDLPTKEVGRELGVSAGTVKSWLARGRRELGAQLDEEVSSHHG